MSPDEKVMSLQGNAPCEQSYLREKVLYLIAIPLPIAYSVRRVLRTEYFDNCRTNSKLIFQCIASYTPLHLNSKIYKILRAVCENECA